MEIRKQKGITLISLIVAIIILIILAGITIAAMTGENGILKKSQEAKKKHEIAQYQEYINLAVTDTNMNDWKQEKSIYEKYDQIQEFLKNEKYFKGATFKIDEYDEKDSLIITTKEGYIFVVTENEVKYIGLKDEVDKIPDLEEADITIEIEPTTWTNDKVQVEIIIKNTEYEGYKIEYSKDLINWTKYTGIFEENENTTIYAKITNGLVETDNYISNTIGNIDKIDPEMISITKSDVSWSGSTGTVMLTGKAKDVNSGIDGYQFSKDGNLIATSNGWKEITATTEETIQTENVTEEGTWYFYVKDQAGNINKNSIVVAINDLREPDIELKASTEGWTNEDVTLTGTSQDTESGLVAYAWTETPTEPAGTTTTGELGKWTNITQTTDKIIERTVLSENGTRYFWTKDAIGNVSSATITVTKIDKNDPQMISLTQSESTWHGSIERKILTGKAKDVDSGINRYQFSKNASLTAKSDGWEEISETTAEITKTIEVTEGGTWYFYVIDQAGNVNRSSIVVTLGGDLISPEIELTANTTSTANKVTLTGSSQDIQSGLVAYAWTETSTEPIGTTTTGELGKWTSITQTTSKITRTIELTENGTRYFWTKDAKGNTNNASITVTNIVSKVNISAYSGLTLVAGNTGTPTLTYTGTPKSTSFSSSNASVATVNATTGVVTGVASGTTTMTVTMTNYDGTKVTKTCTVTVQKAIAKVGTVNYASIANAISAISSSGTVTMIDGTSETITISSEKNITLALEGKTITGTINNNGILTVNGTGTINGDTSNAITSTGTLTITLATITNASTGKATIAIKGGTANIKSGTISNSEAYRTIMVNSGATLNVNGGRIVSKHRAVDNEGIVNINGGTLTTSSTEAGTIRSNSTTTISGGTIQSTGMRAIKVEGGTTTIKGSASITNGTIKNSAVVVGKNGTLYVQGTPNITSGGNGILVDGILKFEGGTVTTPNKEEEAIDINPTGNVNITGGTIENTGNGKAIINQGTLTINGAKVHILGGHATSVNYPTVLNTGDAVKEISYKHGTIKNTADSTNGYCYVDKKAGTKKKGSLHK